MNTLPLSLEEKKQRVEKLAKVRSDWKVAQSFAKAMKLANVGEDFTSKLMADSALSAVQDGLNMAFSELDASLLDDPAPPVTATVLPQAKKMQPQLPEKAGPPPMDFLDAEFEAAPVGVAKGKKKA